MCTCISICESPHFKNIKLYRTSQSIRASTYLSKADMNEFNLSFFSVGVLLIFGNIEWQKSNEISRRSICDSNRFLNTPQQYVKYLPLDIQDEYLFIILKRLDIYSVKSHLVAKTVLIVLNYWHFFSVAVTLITLNCYGQVYYRDQWRPCFMIKLLWSSLLQRPMTTRLYDGPF